MRSATALTAMLALLALVSSGCEKNGDAMKTETSGTIAGYPIIDSHAHIYLEEYDESLEPLLVGMMEKNGIRWFDICTIGLSWDSLKEQVRVAGRLNRLYPDRFDWAVSFNLTNWGSPDWETETITYIGEGFDNGAAAVKVWKEIGMELKDPDGSYVMIDDPRFAPVFDYIESRDKALVCHLGEPRNCWLPLEEMTVDGDRNYFRGHPEYHAYKHPEIPSYEAQIAARDRILEHHPNLRVVGCHLGSLEYDVAELAKRLDAYPNFAVDTAARIIHFKVQDRDKVRAFCIEYADRILYGTDLGVRSMEDIERRLEQIERICDEDYRYFSTDGAFTIAEREEPVRGLDLPDDVVRKIFYENAVKWYRLR